MPLFLLYKQGNTCTEILSNVWITFCDQIEDKDSSFYLRFPTSPRLRKSHTEFQC